MAKVFKYGFILFIVVAFLTNHQSDLFIGILNTPLQVFDLTKTIVLSACLWNGLLNIIKSSGFIHHLSFLLKPILRLIYGHVVDDEHVYLYLSSNFIANLLGVGSLATISGLKAMKSLQKYQNHQHVPCKETMMLVIINTTGLSLVPSAMMSLRQSYHSQDLLSFFKYSVVIGIVITVIGVIVAKIIEAYG